MLYDYECTQCKHKFDDLKSIEERHTSVCPECGSEAKLIMSFGSQVHTFKPYWDKHISDKPVYIESMEQKKNLMKANGLVQADYHVDGDEKTTRWI